MSEEKQSWREILAEAAAQFMTTKPSDVKEWFRRLAVVTFLSFTALTTFTLVRYPEWVSMLSPRPIAERNIETRLAEVSGMSERVTNELEDWFYSHRPHGLMMVSWHDLNELSGVWLRPRGTFPEKEGHHTLTPDMRLLAGPFVFGECKDVPFDRDPTKVLVACPIHNQYDVWGYVAAVVEPDKANVDYMLRSVNNLTARIKSILYN